METKEARSKVRFNIHLRKEAARLLKHEKAETDLTFSEIVELALAAHIKRREQEARSTSRS